MEPADRRGSRLLERARHQRLRQEDVLRVADGQGRRHYLTLLHIGHATSLWHYNPEAGTMRGSILTGPHPPPAEDLALAIYWLAARQGHPDAPPWHEVLDHAGWVTAALAMVAERGARLLGRQVPEAVRMLGNSATPGA